MAIAGRREDSRGMNTTAELWDIGPEARVDYVWSDPSAPPRLTMSTGARSVVLVAPSTPERLDAYWMFFRALKKATTSMELHLHPALFWGRRVSSGEAGRPLDGG